MPAHVASPEARAAHREWIGGAIRTLLGLYGDFPADPRVVAEWGKMWADGLEGFPRQIIEAAIKDWCRSEQKRPTPAGLIAMCLKRTPRPAPEPEAPKPLRCSPEQAAKNLEIIARYWPDRFRRAEIINSAPEPF